MTAYYLTRILDQPYRIELYHDGHLELELRPMSSPAVVARADSVVGLLDEEDLVACKDREPLNQPGTSS
jgi:hypothetical protein